MIDTLVVATDGSRSGERAVVVALDLARRFDATVHALSVVATAEREDESEDMDASVRRRRAERAVEAVAERTEREVTTIVREGQPAEVICQYASEHAVDVVATGTRGRHGEHRFLLGSVAEQVVRTCPVPVLTVRQLERFDE